MKKIGITCRAEDFPANKANALKLIGTTTTYIEAVKAAGALPILIPLDNSQEELDAYLDIIDGIIITGGGDIDPTFYDMPQLQGIGEIDIDRDESDLAILEASMQRKIPVFGICRGCQLLNVYCGGTLYQDMRYIDTQYEHSQQNIRHAVAHTVKAEKGSKLYQLFGEQEGFGVNSFHHQAVNRLGKNLKATLISPDGVIEGIELDSSEQYAVAVQFHPEMFVASKEYAYMTQAFKRFVNLV